MKKLYWLLLALCLTGCYLPPQQQPIVYDQPNRPQVNLGFNWGLPWFGGGYQPYYPNAGYYPRPVYSPMVHPDCCPQHSYHPEGGHHR